MKHKTGDNRECTEILLWSSRTEESRLSSDLLTLDVIRLDGGKSCVARSSIRLPALRPRSRRIRRRAVKAGMKGRVDAPAFICLTSMSDDDSERSGGHELRFDHINVTMIRRVEPFKNTSPFYTDHRSGLTVQA